MTEVVTSAAADRSATPDKVLFPEAGLTKLDLARLLRARAPRRCSPTCAAGPSPSSATRDGIDGTGFFMKNGARHFPDWIAHASGAQARGRDDRQSSPTTRRPSSTSPART